jgi:hypothetical protein
MRQKTCTWNIKKYHSSKMKLNLSRPPLDIAPDDKSFHETLNTVYKYCWSNQKEFQKQVLKLYLKRKRKTIVLLGVMMR